MEGTPNRTKRMVATVLAAGVAALTSVSGAGASVYRSDSSDGPRQSGLQPMVSTAHSMKSRQAIEREIVISPEDEPLVHEYGVNGRIWAIEVTPAGAPSYFLVEAGGDGRLRTRPNGLAPALLVPAWEVIRR